MFLQQRAFSYHRFSDVTKRVVTDEREFWDIIYWLMRHPVIAYDCETSGTSYYKYACICGVSFAVWNPAGGTFAFYFPCRHQTGEKQLPVHVVMAGLKLILEAQHIRKVVWNLKFEMHMAHREGIHFAGPRDDGMIKAHLYDENTPLSLKTRANVDLQDPRPSMQEGILDHELKLRAKEVKMGITEYKDHFGYAQLPVDLCGTYACHDTDATLRLDEFYNSHGVPNYFARVYNTEVDLQDALFEMEENGMPIDVPYLHHLKHITGQACDQLAPQIFSALGGYQFNIGSDEQLRHVLTNRLGLKLWKITDAGRTQRFAAQKKGWHFDASKFLAVDKEVLEYFAEDHPVCALLLEWRQASKIKSTYTDSILARIDSNHLLHGDVKALGTNTGRTSSEKPNLQNFSGDSDVRALRFSGKKLEDGGIDPWSVKRAFINRGPGWHRRYWDYSQIELRVLAKYAMDPTMIDVYLKGQDIHERTSLEVFGNKDKATRRKSKVINFGLSYCLEENTAILTHRGRIPIQDVLPTDLLWDGLEWVEHDGVVYQGWKEVIEHEGIVATPGHEVFTADERKLPLADALADGLPLAHGACGASPVGYAGPLGKCEDRAQRERTLDALRRGGVLGLHRHAVAACVERRGGQDDELRLSAQPQVPRRACRNAWSAFRRHGATLRAGYARVVGALQRAWDQGAVQVTRALYPLGAPEMAGHGFQGARVRPEEQRRALRADEPAARHAEGEPQEPPSTGQRKAHVYDILNAGPRNRFCANGKIVSNCMSAGGFSRQAKIPLEEAEVAMSRFFDRYPRIGPFRQELWAYARGNKNSITNIFGRPRRIQELASYDKWARLRAERQMVGSCIQGTAAELTKESIVRIHKWEKANGAGIKLCSTIHDEISADVPIRHAYEVGRAVKQMMCSYEAEFSPVPIEIDDEFSTASWADKHKTKTAPFMPKELAA